MATMQIEFLHRVPLVIVLAGLFLAMAASWIIGRRLGVIDRERCDEDSRTHATGLHAAMLGLLALLLGFTFSMAAQRFETARDLVAHEASAIETAYLRADFALEPDRLAIRDALRRYIDTRIAFYDAKIDLRKRTAVEKESQRLIGEVWRHASATAARTPSPTTALLVEGVNEAMDLHTQRLLASRNFVPSTILWLLMIMSVAATGLTGYVAGFGNRRHPAPTAVVLLLIAMVIVVIFDLNRPTRGLIRGGQESLIDLQRSLSAEITALR
jgi:hypothetical protein